MRRLTILMAVLSTITGCAFREVKREIVTIDGKDFLCSHTENKLSGNESDPNCTRVTP